MDDEITVEGEHIQPNGEIVLQFETLRTLHLLEICTAMLNEVDSYEDVPEDVVTIVSGVQTALEDRTAALKTIVASF